jgi:colanic acid/amylovoran biosynthesis glycosyltransferase
MSLAILPALAAGSGANGNVRLTQKFIDGMNLYAEYWPGRVVAYLERNDDRSSNLDEVDVNPSDLSFGYEIVSYTDPKMGELLAKHEAVLGSTDAYRQIPLADLCRSLGVPFLFTSEYSFNTKWQIICAGTNNPVRRLRRLWWSMNQERRLRQAIRIASGIQCNGTPTYDDYSKLNSRRLLFFDTRVAESMLVTEDELSERTASLLKGEPLRLMFSGRLIPMKGADDLIRVAEALRRLGVRFHLTICGNGTLTDSIRADIARRGLSDFVSYAGVLDFKRELVPMTKQKVDLFLCCHRSGDPSCTYTETMACGVPIIGYANEAFQGIVRESGTGWAVSMNRPDRMAAEIARLNSDRRALAEAAHKSLEFARAHTFERTFRARIDHLSSFRSPSLQRS